MIRYHTETRVPVPLFGLTKYKKLFIFARTLVPRERDGCVRKCSGRHNQSKVKSQIKINPLWGAWVGDITFFA